MTELTYEQAMEQLRSIVQKLEAGQQGLEQSLQLFEEGIELTKLCDQKLRAVEDRVQVLLTREDSPE